MGSSNSAIQKSAHGVQGVQGGPEVHERAELKGLEWNDLRLIAEVAKYGSFRTSARNLKISVNTLRTRIERMEHRLGEAIVARSFKGVSLTPAGARLRAIALSMRGAAVAGGVETSSYLRRPDELRIGTSEGLGSGWLTPRLLELQERFPNLTMTMWCDNNLEANHSQDLDIGIVWQVPRNPDLVVSKLATLHFMPFASRGYVQKFGVPHDVEDLLDHRFIEQASPGVRSELLDQLVGTDRPDGFLPIRTNSSLAVFWAVANDAGIAFMPTYATALVSKLVPIDLPFRLKFDIFYYFHPEARDCEIVRAGVEWLKTCFDPASNPWFRKEFIHPKEFFTRSDSVVVPLFTSLGAI